MGQDFDDSMSGTTAITAFFKGTQFTVANIGDSRAVVGEKKGRRVIAYSLSIDQTPYRQDERERVKASGAVVMSCDQLEGIVPYHENWGVNLGEVSSITHSSFCCPVNICFLPFKRVPFLILPSLSLSWHSLYVRAGAGQRWGPAASVGTRQIFPRLCFHAFDWR